MATVGSVNVEIAATTQPFMQSMRIVSKEVTKLSNQLGLMFSGMAWSANFTAPFLVGMGTAINASIDFEQAMAGVKKTVDASEADFARIENNIRAMSTEMPVSAERLAKITQAAGQMGVRGVQNIDTFTDTVARLGVSTDLVGEEAAMTMARFSTITQMPISQVEGLGSTIVGLGNNVATNESEIAEFAMRLAGAGKVIGLSEADILGFSASLAALGINPGFPENYT